MAFTTMCRVLDIIFCTDVQCFLARRRPKVLKEYYCSNNESGGMSSASTVIDIRKQLRANASRMKDVRIANRCRRTFRQPALAHNARPCPDCQRAHDEAFLALVAQRIQDEEDDFAACMNVINSYWASQQ
ncbi:hypothetical protein CLAFUW4_04231 [Fulvia fulva]|uniref:Uncharacterized protein n=1 Tax=Passalora fulva TaxID=5499 RepID=A0A9Q8LFH4_PASFU|nr:uncharacterized protein CLAFUR5_04197 [Fulvia fulva]KAK4626081.1 hypothetical protein CLAFUR4_04217 [Fulvia fulva]KAK4627743.1 hypothetical protein CLAFUR0_04219 [Fulvia fulva]UJO16492.1 hypothetical protein CLAFUR5_04197 [Fulvia fulva]WPV13658.1 hypothetical protein CLAFUW4_04231 [Fulvia fulva]WPV28806.1 hypothetical protein CLAFUW7_04220 [Fulvia fulva]